MTKKTDYLSRIQSDAYSDSVFGQTLTLTMFHNSQRTNQYIICKEILTMIPVTIYTRKDYFLLSVLNEKIELLKAAGFIELWQFREHKKISNNISEPGVLNMHQLVGCFHILIFGYSFSLVLFFGELIWHKLRITSN